MTRLKTLSVLLILALAVPLPARQLYKMDYSKGAGTFPNFGIYNPPEVPEANLADTGRMQELIRAGKLYLTLADAIALALENNLDIEVARYSPLEADSDILRSKSGAQLSGVQTQISTLSTAQSASGQAVGGGARGQATGVTEGASTQAQNIGGGGGAAGNAASFFGTQTTSLDPTFSVTVTPFHTTNPQISSFVLGTNTLVQEGQSVNLSYQQGFVTGTQINVGFTTFGNETSDQRAEFNPTLTGDLSASVTQRLLQGFGTTVNRRNIVIARNNRKIEDLNFKLQLMTTVSQLQNLYWDLVAFIEDAKARRTDYDLATQLVVQTQKQVDLGMQARVEVLRVQAEATSFRQQLVAAESTVRQQQEILKNALTKHGPATLLGVDILPLDSIVVPETELIEPVQDLVVLALESQPALAGNRIARDNSDINLKGIRDALKPSLDVTAFATNNGLVGSINEDAIPNPGPPPDPFFIGGLGNLLGQVFRRDFPDYGVRFNLNVPVKNRQAQADMTRELLRRRKTDITLRQQENSIKLDVVRAVDTLQQAHESYLIAKESRELREQMLEAEQKRFALGSSTIFQIVQAQRDLAAARTGEVNGLRSYSSSRVSLDRVVGRTLEVNNVSIDEAWVGRVFKRSDPIPPALLTP